MMRPVRDHAEAALFRAGHEERPPGAALACAIHVSRKAYREVAAQRARCSTTRRWTLAACAIAAGAFLNFRLSVAPKEPSLTARPERIPLDVPRQTGKESSSVDARESAASQPVDETNAMRPSLESRSSVDPIRQRGVAKRPAATLAQELQSLQQVRTALAAGDAARASELLGIDERSPRGSALVGEAAAPAPLRVCRASASRRRGRENSRSCAGMIEK